MGARSKTKKLSKDLSKQKTKTKTHSLRKDMKKAKLKVQSLNKDERGIAEIVKLSGAGIVRRAPCTLNALANTTLQKEWKKDMRTREKSEAEKQAVADKLEKQIESFSGFTLQ